MVASLMIGILTTKQGYQFGRQVELIYQIGNPNPGLLKPPATCTNENTSNAIDRSEKKQAI